MAKSFTLGKNERLKSRKLIEQLFSEGKSFSSTPFKVFYSLNDDGEPLQAGVGVSSKIFKKATDRNRVKRLIRESWRLQKNPLREKLNKTGKKLSVFIIYTGREIPWYEKIYERTGVMLKKLDTFI